MKKIVLLTAVLFLVSLAGPAMADSSMFGFVQSWLSYTAYTAADGDSVDTDGDEIMDAAATDATQLAFGVRRARVGWKYKSDTHFGKFQGDGGGGTFKVLDAYVGRKVNDMVTVQIGRFVGVGSQAGGLTSATKLDLVERSIVGRRWAAGTVGGDYRTYGLMASIVPNELFKINVQISNGFGSVNAAPSSNSHAAAGGLIDDSFAAQLDFGVYATPMEGLGVGFTYGLPNENLNTTGSMTAHAYYKLPNMYLKFDTATLANNPVWDDDDADFTSMGYAITGGYSVSEKAEIIARYETWDGNTDLGNDDGDYMTKNFQVGVNVYCNPDAKYDQVFKLSFTRRMDEMPDDVDIPDPNLVQAMWQIFFH